MSSKKIKKLNDAEYKEFIKELLGEDSSEVIEPNKKD